MAARQMTARHPAAALPPVIALGAAGLAVASVIELLILRTFTRTAIHIPGITALREPYEVLSFGGRYAYFVAVTLLLFAVPAAAWTLWSRGGPVRRGMAVATGVFAAMSGLAAMEVAGRLALDTATAGTVRSSRRRHGFAGTALDGGRADRVVRGRVRAQRHPHARSIRRSGGGVTLRTDAALTCGRGGWGGVRAGSAAAPPGCYGPRVRRIRSRGGSVVFAGLPGEWRGAARFCSSGTKDSRGCCLRWRMPARPGAWQPRWPLSPGPGTGWLSQAWCYWSPAGSDCTAPTSPGW